MVVFKRGIFSLIRAIAMAVFGAPALALIISFFTENILIITIPSGTAGLWLLYLAIFSENISFEIGEDGNFKYIQRGNVKLELNLKEYYCGYRTKTSDGSADDLTLRLYKADDSEAQINLDCTALGISKFHKMYALIESYAAKEDNKLEVRKSSKKAGK